MQRRSLRPLCNIDLGAAREEQARVRGRYLGHDVEAWGEGVDVGSADVPQDLASPRRGCAGIVPTESSELVPTATNYERSNDTPAT